MLDHQFMKADCCNGMATQAIYSLSETKDASFALSVKVIIRNMEQASNRHRYVFCFSVPAVIIFLWVAVSFWTSVYDSPTTGTLNITIDSCKMEGTSEILRLSIKSNRQHLTFFWSKRQQDGSFFQAIMGKMKINDPINIIISNESSINENCNLSFTPGYWLEQGWINIHSLFAVPTRYGRNCVIGITPHWKPDER